MAGGSDWGGYGSSPFTKFEFLLPHSNHLNEGREPLDE